ncbi:hypothetical protein G6F50_016754 [Rhizopus delemar]|uniref:LysR substrate-binding domain-containing protein n=1 Tax=Rhizopus delemar TaxID=936053 RepID=A0A9P6XSJ2_9FUNG|nr:hypothetical protein G6F50_016754 [Rhizopus delemar]
MGLVRHRIRSSGAGGEAVLRIATGRSLARTLVADWIARLRHRTPKVLTEGTQVELSTGKAQDLVVRLEQGKVDLLCCYEHPALSVPLSPARYRYMTLATDKLVPVRQRRRPAWTCSSVAGNATTAGSARYSDRPSHS